MTGCTRVVPPTPLVRRYFVDLARTCGALCRRLPGATAERPASMPRPVRALV